MSKFTMTHAVAIVGVWLAPVAAAFALRATDALVIIIAVCVGFCCAWFATICITETAITKAPNAEE